MRFLSLPLSYAEGFLVPGRYDNSHGERERESEGEDENAFALCVCLIQCESLTLDIMNGGFVLVLPKPQPPVVPSLHLRFCFPPLDAD